MSNTIRTFLTLPPSLQDLAVQLAVIRAGQQEYKDLSEVVTEAVIAAGAALKVGAMPEVAVDLAKPGEDQTAYQQAEPAGPNPEYKDPEIFDPKDQNDAIDALGYLVSALREIISPDKHCGRTDCEACNEMFGNPELKPESNKLRFVQIDRKDGVSGPVDVYQSRSNPKVFAILNGGKTAVVESENIMAMPYPVAVEIVKIHGKADRSIVG